MSANNVSNGAYVAGDKVTYYRMHGDACAAEVLSVSPRGRLRLRVHQGGAVPYYTATNVLPTSVHRRENAKSEVRSGQYDAAPADAHLEAALAKLREYDDSKMFVEVNYNEAAALLAKIEDADGLAQRVDEYLNGKWLGRGLMDALADYTGKPWAPSRNPQPAGEEPAGGGEKSGEFASAPPDKTYQHALVRRLWEAQLGDLPDDVKRLMAEAATEIEGNLPATDDFVNSMRRKHAKVIR